MVHGVFLDRVVYTCLFIFLVVAIFEWPRQYGERLFNPSFSVATLPVGAIDPGRCDEQKLSKGPRLLADEQVITLLRVCIDRSNGARFLDFFVYDRFRVLQES